MNRSELIRAFEQTVLPHMSAAYNLARWLTRNSDNAEDVVQEAYLRALRYFDRFHGGDSKAWLLAIVRNTAYSWLEANRPADVSVPFDEHDPLVYNHADTTTPETLLLRNSTASGIKRALEELPVSWREVFVLREIEELSYREIALIVNIPMGTVMSRLARARKRLLEILVKCDPSEVKP